MISQQTETDLKTVQITVYIFPHSDTKPSSAGLEEPDSSGSDWSRPEAVLPEPTCLSHRLGPARTCSLGRRWVPAETRLSGSRLALSSAAKERARERRIPELGPAGSAAPESFYGSKNFPDLMKLLFFKSLWNWLKPLAQIFQLPAPLPRCLFFFLLKFQAGSRCGMTAERMCFTWEELVFSAAEHDLLVP